MKYKLIKDKDEENFKSTKKFSMLSEQLNLTKDTITQHQMQMDNYQQEMQQKAF